MGCHAYREFEPPGLRPGAPGRGLEPAGPPPSDAARGGAPTTGSSACWTGAGLPDRDPGSARRRRCREHAWRALRAERSHHVFDPAPGRCSTSARRCWTDRVRLHVGMDLLIADAVSMVQLFREWGALYRDPVRVLPPRPAAFAQHCRARAARMPAAPGTIGTRGCRTCPAARTCRASRWPRPTALRAPHPSSAGRRSGRA